MLLRLTRDVSFTTNADDPRVADGNFVNQMPQIAPNATAGQKLAAELAATQWDTRPMRKVFLKAGEIIDIGPEDRLWFLTQYPSLLVAADTNKGAGRSGTMFPGAALTY